MTVHVEILISPISRSYRDWAVTTIIDNDWARKAIADKALQETRKVSSPAVGVKMWTSDTGA